MKSLCDGLPPEIARQVHPDLLKNERDYWTHREELLENYRNQWVGFADGTVIAFGRSPVQVLHQAMGTGRHPFVTRVGYEHVPHRIRRTVFKYDQDYGDEPLPIIIAEFRAEPRSAGIRFDRVIPDTGADVTTLPWADCLRLGLDPSQGTFSRIGGISESTAETMAFPAWVRIENQDVPCILQAALLGTERLLGRDVLNRFEVLFRGPTGEVIFNP